MLSVFPLGILDAHTHTHTHTNTHLFTYTYILCQDQHHHPHYHASKYIEKDFNVNVCELDITFK
jgi:hypothetical protein